MLMLNWIRIEIELFDHLTVCKQKLDLCQTELFEIELFDHLSAC